MLDLRGFAERIFFKDEFRAPWGPHHIELMGKLSTPKRGKRYNILMPRGAAKTTLLLIIYVLQRICNKDIFKALGLPYDTFIVIICQNERIAYNRLQDIKLKIENTPELQDLKGTKTWRIEELITSNNIRLIGRGRGSPIRGSLFGNHRPSLILIDDMEHAEELKNPDIRADQQLWFDTDVLKAGEIDGSTDVIISDTLKHEESILGTLKTLPGWETLFYEAISHPNKLYHPTREALWKKWEGFYTDMTKEIEERDSISDKFYNQNIDQMTEDVVELWPANHQLRYINIRKSMCNEGYFPVMRELQNTTRDPRQEIFDMESAITFTVESDGLQRSDKRLVEWNRFAGATVFLDWAGGRDRVEDCYACAVLVLWEPMITRYELENSGITHPLAKTHCYVLDVWLDKIKLTDQVRAMFQLLQDNLGQVMTKKDLRIRVGIEDIIRDNTGTIKDSVTEAYNEIRKDFPSYSKLALNYHPRSSGKIDRIAALEPSITHGWLSFNKALPAEFMREMRQFPNADFNDGPDALQGATEMTVNSSVEESRIARGNRKYFQKKRGVIDL